MKIVLLFVLFVTAWCHYSLGVCYYPEHWPLNRWEDDIRSMKSLGLKYVRVGEFMWSVVEPEYKKFNWTVLDHLLELCSKHGLQVVLGTPTATPPKWLIDRYGGNGHDSRVLPFDLNGNPRKFGSRRHYSFSSDVYVHESERIVIEYAKRYGNHPALIGWQTDNEYGCHSTTRTYDAGALKHFRKWLQEKYQNNITSLNEAWGQVFWSAHYHSFEAIDLPHQTVTEAFPAHWFDFYKFSSDQIVKYNKMQVDIIRSLSPNRFITHNFMGWFFEFDHYDVANSGLDFASWDSYPLGFTDTSTFFSAEEKGEYIRSGHPDLPSFHHDLYRGVSRGKPFWVMEQQPGPVNWAENNPSPAPGMIRLWSWEAFAHGADTVSYFRWRQAPFAQEQMHAGLNLPNYKPDVAYFEAKQVVEEIETVKPFLGQDTSRRVAIVFDYLTEWAYKIQPQGKSFDYIKLTFSLYSGLRQVGLDVDLVPPGSNLLQYSLVVIPSLFHINEKTYKSFQEFVQNGKGVIVFGPRSGSKNQNLSFSTPMPPGYLQEFIPIQVNRVESFGPHAKLEEIKFENREFEYSTWREHVEILDYKVETLANFMNDGKGALFAYKQVEYVGFFPEKMFIQQYVRHLCKKAQLKCLELEKNVRIARSHGLCFAQNFNSKEIKTPAEPSVNFILGGPNTPAYGVSIWKNEQ